MFLHLSVILFIGGFATHTHTHTDTPPTMADTPLPGQTHTDPGNHTPVQCMLGYGQQAGGTHPTGMHSCY